MGTLAARPRVYLQDYPRDVQDALPPKTKGEKRAAARLSIPFFLYTIGIPIASTIWLSATYGPWSFGVRFVYAYVMFTMANLCDLVILDLIIFSGITPRFVVIPGTEGLPGYKDMARHLLGFAKGSAVALVGALLVAFCGGLL